MLSDTQDFYLKENLWLWKNAKNPLTGELILSKLLLFSKQTMDFLILLSFCASHSNPSLKTKQNKNGNKSKIAKQNRNCCKHIKNEKHILGVNVKHKYSWLNLKEVLSLCFHYSHFLVSNYSFLLKGSSNYSTATVERTVLYPSLVQNENKYHV